MSIRTFEELSQTMSIRTFEELSQTMIIRTFEELSQTIENILLTPRSHVLFDVDEVLITQADQYLHPAVYSKLGREHLFYKVFNSMTKWEEQQKYGEWISQIPVRLIDQRIPDLVQHLQNFTNVMGITRMIPGAGEAGPIQKMEDFRRQELLQFDIDFTRAAVTDREIVFTSEVDNLRHPLYKDGILYTRPYSKGEVYEKFLIETSCFPDKVVFIDDSEFNIRSVAKITSKYQIPFYGLVYKDHRLENLDVDVKLGSFQFKHFSETGVWLTDQEARQQMGMLGSPIMEYI